MIRCNNCMREFEEEEDLAKILITEDVNKCETGELYKNQAFDEEIQEVINGCPKCLTDDFLMDIK